MRITILSCIKEQNIETFYFVQKTCFHKSMTYILQFIQQKLMFLMLLVKDASNVLVKNWVCRYCHFTIKNFVTLVY